MSTELEFHPLANVLPLIEGEEFERLVEDIRIRGLQEKITLYKGFVLDGRNRYRACKAAGFEIEVMNFDEYTGDDPLSFVISLNIHRRHLDESQRAMAGAKFANMRQGTRTDLAQICAMSQSEAAARLNVSRRSIQYAKQVSEHGVPELIAAVEKGGISVSAAADIAKFSPEQQATILKAAKKITQARAEENKRLRNAIRDQKIAAIPDGQYRDVVMDPSWPVEGPDLIGTPDGGPVDYPTMSVEEIRDWGLMVLPGITPPDCNLFVWTTQTFLRDTIDLVGCWGFRYMGLFVWNKVTANGQAVGKPNPGFPMNNCEFVVYARKGKADFTETAGLRWCFNGVRREHSRKPDEFFKMIAAATSGPRVSLFDREARDGFTVGGNETNMFDEANQRADEERAEADEILRELGLLEEAAE
jgi:N6-adenosine-specific RNA methylase IME4/ParB-like chromosome segregation protein Spo0J